MRIYDAIDAAAKALKSGAHPNILRMALMSDGFSASKAEIILGWANQTIKVEAFLTEEEYND